MKDSKRTIAIVCGGDSSEHDVSMRSGQGLYSFFDKERYNIYIVDVKGIDWHAPLGHHFLQSAVAHPVAAVPPTAHRIMSRGK